MITSIRNQIKDLENKIINIQTGCSHPVAAVTKLSEWTDDSGLDAFPVTKSEYRCGLCELKWSESKN